METERQVIILRMAVLLGDGYGKAESYSFDDLDKQARNELEKPDFSGTFCLGFDLKKTPRNNWYIIEINGRNSGLKGIEKVNKEFSQDEFYNSAKRKFEMILSSHPDALLDAYSRYRRTEEKILEEGIESELVHGLYKKMQFNTDKFEEMLSNKAYQKLYLPQELVAPFVLVSDDGYRPTFFTRWMDESPHHDDFDKDLVVIKSPTGVQGRDVSVRSAKRLRNKDLVKDSMIEPFVISIPIVSSEDGKEHDGCMRYGVIVNVSSEGNIEFVHAGGYWRLSPKPLENSSAKLRSKLTANLARGALAQEASDHEIREVQAIVERATLHLFTKFYNRDFVQQSTTS